MKLYYLLGALILTASQSVQAHLPTSNCHWRQLENRWVCPADPAAGPRDHRTGYRELEVAMDSILGYGEHSTMSLGGHYFVHELAVLVEPLDHNGAHLTLDMNGRQIAQWQFHDRRAALMHARVEQHGDSVHFVAAGYGRVRIRAMRATVTDEGARYAGGYPHSHGSTIPYQPVTPRYGSSVPYPQQSTRFPYPQETVRPGTGYRPFPAELPLPGPAESYPHQHPYPAETPRYGYGYEQNRTLTEDVTPLADRAILLVDMLQGYTDHNTFGSYLLPVKKAAAEARAAGGAYGALSRAPFERLLSALDRAQPYLSNMYERSAAFESATELMGIREHLRRALR